MSLIPPLAAAIRCRRAGVVALVAGLQGLALGCTSFAARADDTLWSHLAAGGVTVLLRHASTTAGLGDPPNFRLGDCSTQRNLSEAGREESRRIGRAFEARRVPLGPVLAGEWCRTRDTAQLAFGRHDVDTSLNSFFGERAREAPQVARMRTLVTAAPRDRVQILVTHQVNITALTGEVPAMGEAIVVRPAADGSVAVVGRLRAAD